MPLRLPGESLFQFVEVGVYSGGEVAVERIARGHGVDHDAAGLVFLLQTFRDLSLTSQSIDDIRFLQLKILGNFLKMILA